MEPRQLLAAFTVTSLADSGPGTLRDAIERANRDPERDTIAFTGGLGGTIALGEALPDLTSPIDLEGPGTSLLTIARAGAEGTPQFRLLTVGAGAEVSLTNLTLSGGSAEAGGAVSNAGAMRIVGVTIRDAEATGASGGAIDNAGLLSIAFSTLIGNRSTSTNFPFTAVASTGGAIVNSGTLTIDNTTFEANQALSAGFGGLDSSANARGGAISNGGTLTINDSTFLRNVASSGRGISTQSSGGAIDNAGELSISRTTFRENEADASAIRIVSARGGAIGNAGTLTIADSTFVGNRAATSGGLGPAGDGGAIANLDGHAVVLATSTVSGNSASIGGGISNSGLLTVSRSTIAGNPGGGISNAAPLPTPPLPGQASVTLVGSILAEGPGDSVINRGGRVTSLGNNLFSDAPGIALDPSDLVSTDPLLAPLGDYGGPTMTHALLPGSPAIDAGAVLPGVEADQRAVARPQGRAPDIGAFESRGFALEVVSGNDQDAPINTAFPTPLAVRVSSPFGEPVAGGLVRFQGPASGPMARFTSPATIGPDGLASTAAVAGGEPGSYTVVAASAGAAPAQFTLTNRVDALEVVDVARFGFHARPSRIDLRFNRPLDPSRAADVANYRLLGPGLDRAPGVRPDRPLRLRSASYDASTNTVSLVPAEPLRLLGGRRYLVVVDGAVAPGATGGGTTAVVGAEDFVPSPALAVRLRQVRRLQRFRDGTGRLR